MGRWIGIRLLLALCALVPVPARAIEYRFLGGVDFFAVNNPGGLDSATGEFGLLLRADVLNINQRFDLHLNFTDREPAFGDFRNVPQRQLRELSFTVRDLFGHLDLSLGRMPAAGGFWLIYDGGAARLHLGKLVTIQAYGGLRSYTGGRVEANLRGNPYVLPLGGVALMVDHPVIHATLGYTFTNDVLDFQRGFSNGPLVDKLIGPEHFVDGSFVLLPHPKLFFAGGLTLGTRYEVLFSSAPGLFSAAPTGTAQLMSAFMGYLMGEWRPWKRLRLSYTADFNRIKVASLQNPTDNSAGVASGNFHDHLFKASVRTWRGLRFDARYRLRFRDNDDIIHRVEGSVLGDNLLAGLGLFVTVGADLYDRPAGSKPRDTVVYTGGLSFVKPWLDARAGVLYTDAIGSGVVFSTHQPQAPGAGPTTELFPLVLDAQRIAYVRAFTSFKHVFAGLDVEVNFDGNQVRSLVQVGYGR